MSDARQQAIDAALATGVPIHQGYIAEVIDAIPGDVHARLAIDKGAELFSDAEAVFLCSSIVEKAGIVRMIPGAHPGDRVAVFRLAGKDPQP